jgi:hypothetical protein
MSLWVSVREVFEAMTQVDHDLIQSTGLASVLWLIKNLGRHKSDLRETPRSILGLSLTQSSLRETQRRIIGL